jgi:hypothetical protein
MYLLHHVKLSIKELVRFNLSSAIVIFLDNQPQSRVKRQETLMDQQVFRGDIPEDQPRFVVAYKHGIIQMMRSENDSSLYYFMTNLKNCI